MRGRTGEKDEMPKEMNEKINEAVYVALCCGTAYYTAHVLKVDKAVAVMVGTAVGKLLSIETNT